jgi:hypothetical protein
MLPPSPRQSEAHPAGVQARSFDNAAGRAMAESVEVLLKQDDWGAAAAPVAVGGGPSCSLAAPTSEYLGEKCKDD